MKRCLIVGYLETLGNVAPNTDDFQQEPRYMYIKWKISILIDQRFLGPAFTNTERLPKPSHYAKCKEDFAEIHRDRQGTTTVST
jgi:hypothetical protein